MKKQILNIGLYLCMTFVCFLYTSCSESESDDPNNGRKDPVTATITYSFNAQNDYLLLADLTITYWNEQGKQVSEPLTTTSWSKNFTLNQSQTFGYTVTATAKPNIDELLTKDSYQMGYRYNDSYYSSNGTGQESSTGFSLPVGKAKVKEYIERNAEVHKFHLTWNMDNDTFQ